MRRAAVLLLPAIALLAGCSTVKHIHDAGPGETCAEIMQLGFPKGDVTVTKTQVENPAIASTVVTIDGTRAGIVPAPGVSGSVTAQCRFDHDVLVDFHWVTPPFH